MNNLENELAKLKNDFNNLKKKIEKIHLIFILIYFSIITLIILFFQRNLVTLYNIFFIKILLFSLMVLGLIIHYFLRYKFHKNNKFYKKFFNQKLKKIHKNFSYKKVFNKSIVDYIIKNIKDEESPISKKDLFNFNFWVFLIKNFNIDTDEIIKKLE